MSRFLALAALLAAPLGQLGDSMPAILRALQLPELATGARQAGARSETRPTGPPT